MGRSVGSMQRQTRRADRGTQRRRGRRQQGCGGREVTEARRNAAASERRRGRICASVCGWERVPCRPIMSHKCMSKMAVKTSKYTHKSAGRGYLADRPPGLANELLELGSPGSVTALVCGQDRREDRRLPAGHSTTRSCEFDVWPPHRFPESAWHSMHMHARGRAGRGGIQHSDSAQPAGVCGRCAWPTCGRCVAWACTCDWACL